VPISYVDEVVVRYLMKKGYLVSQGIWFQISKAKTGKKVSGWSDIDIFAVKPNEALLIQCKSFIGTKKSPETVNDISTWFDNALSFLKEDPRYKDWIKNGPKKILVADYSVKITEKELKKYNIEVWRYEKILKDLLKELKNDAETREKGRTGKEEDTLLRILSDMIRRKMITKEVFKEEE